MAESDGVEPEPLEPEGGQLIGHRVVADHQRPTVGYGLQARIAEPFPRRRKGNHVAGLICVVDVHGPFRSGPIGEVRDAPHGGALCRGHEVFELWAVAVLGRAEQPVGGVQAGSRGHACPDVLSGQGPGGLEDKPVVGADAEGSADSRAGG